MPRETASSSIDQFLQPFQLLLWRVIAATLTLAVVLTTIAYTLGRYFNFEEDGTPLFDLKESIMIVYGALFAQGKNSRDFYVLYLFPLKNRAWFRTEWVGRPHDGVDVIRIWRGGFSSLRSCVDFKTDGGSSRASLHNFGRHAFVVLHADLSARLGAPATSHGIRA